MSPFLLLPRTLAKPLQWSLSWPTSSVNHARRNARAALAAQSVRRAEREDVERFLASWRADRTDSGNGVPRPRRAR
jgi:hypothetical protein